MKFFPSTSASTRNLALSAVFVSILIAGCGGGSSDDSGKPTKAMYDQITIDMPYSQVIVIVGSDGRNSTPGSDLFVAKWSKGDSLLSVCLSNNSQVVAKSYRGSETAGNTISQLPSGFKGC
jgi:hypothetical protein